MQAHQRRHRRPQAVPGDHEVPAAAVQPSLPEHLPVSLWRQLVFKRVALLNRAAAAICDPSRAPSPSRAPAPAAAAPAMPAAARGPAIGGPWLAGAAGFSAMWLAHRSRVPACVGTLPVAELAGPLAVPPQVLPLAAPAQALLLPSQLPLVWRVPGALPLLLLWRQGGAGQQDGQDLVLIQVLRN